MKFFIEIFLTKLRNQNNYRPCCRPAATNQPQIGSMNVKLIFFVPLGKSNSDKSIVSVCMTWSQNEGTLAIFAIRARRDTGKFFAVLEPGSRKTFLALDNTVEIATPEKVCNGRK